MNKNAHRYQIGQEVRVRAELDYGETYYMRSGRKANLPNEGNHNGIVIVEDMYALRGKVVHISGYYDDYYTIKECRQWKWADDMFDNTNQVCFCRSLL